MKRIIGLAVIGLATAGCAAQTQAAPRPAQQSSAAAAGSSAAAASSLNTAVCKNWASLKAWANSQAPADLASAMKDLTQEMVKIDLYATEANGQLKADLTRDYNDRSAVLQNMGSSSSASQAKVKADDHAVDSDCA